VKIVEYILLLGSIQGILLSVLLFSKKINHTANVVLGIAMLALSFDVFHSAYILFSYYFEFPHYIGITYAFPFLYGPIFYIYTKLISSGENTFNPKYYLHFIPFVLVVIYGLVFVYFRSAEFKLTLIDNESGSAVPGLEIINYLKPIHGIIYVLLTIKVLRGYNSAIKTSYSNIEKINLNWLRHLTIGLTVIWSIVVLSYIANILSERTVKLDYWIYMAASVLIYSIGYLSLLQPQIFSAVNQKPEDKADDKLKIMSGGGTTYQRSGLSDHDAQSYLQNLQDTMERDKPYLNSDLTLRELADSLSMSTHNLSEILNTRLNKNFYDFINHYRVEEVKRRLTGSESKYYSLIAIAYDSGFNSKSAFNTIFKKQTGTTPSQYRKQST